MSTKAAVDRRLSQFGVDLALAFAGPSGYFEGGDLVSAVSPARTPRARDLALVAGVSAAEQMLINRIKTQRGELTPLGHPEYGSRHHELIGMPNVQRTRNLIKVYVLEALSHEPRVARVLSCNVYAPGNKSRSEVRIDMVLALIDQPTPLNLVVPFSLAVVT